MLYADLNTRGINSLYRSCKEMAGSFNWITVPNAFWKGIQNLQGSISAQVMGGPWLMSGASIWCRWYKENPGELKGVKLEVSYVSAL